MTEETGGGETITEGKLLHVFLNVLCFFAIILSVFMFIFGCVMVGTCPTQPGLPISIILQGTFTIGMPILFLIKNRCGCKMKMTMFLTIFIIFLVFSVGILITCTHFVNASGCEEKDVYKGGVAFVVILWLAVGVATVTGLSCLCYRTQPEDPQDNIGSHNQTVFCVDQSLRPPPPPPRTSRTSRVRT